MLRLDYEQLETSANSLIEQGNTFESCIESMTSTVNSLPDIWEADTCDAYVEQYNEAKVTLNKVRELIQDMADQMKAIAANFRQADEDMTSQMSGR
ncbi:MAG: WXG100 family type VII secretion target [Lachnospiraceae bacterium]|nr:WXG100 family type VII secretion target [Lachnospiraceae bacterium]